jgi:hypothetical protein
MPELDVDKLGLYLVEGTVEVDPITNQVTIRTVNREGQPFSFDPVAVLAQFKGVEIRFVAVPMTSVAELEALAKAQGVVVMDGKEPPAQADPTSN